MMIPYPHDFVSAWQSKHKLDLPMEAYDELTHWLEREADYRRRILQAFPLGAVPQKGSKQWAAGFATCLRACTAAVKES